MTTQTTSNNEVCAALRRFAEGALALADALEGGVAAEVTAAPPTGCRSYSTGRELGELAERKRRDATERAASIGYDLEFWAKQVRNLRTKVCNANINAFARMLGVTSSCVTNWECGTTFANSANLHRLEVTAQAIAGWSSDDWKKDSADSAGVN